MNGVGSSRFKDLILRHALFKTWTSLSKPTSPKLMMMDLCTGERSSIGDALPYTCEKAARKEYTSRGREPLLAAREQPVVAEANVSRSRHVLQHDCRKSQRGACCRSVCMAMMRP
jgi:hypothetical protein